MRNVAIVGISGYGRIHLEMTLRLVQSGRWRLVAAVVINPEAERATCDRLREGGCEVYGDIGEMLARHSGHIDLCLLPTPIHLHRTMAEDALRAGANVLVEKPLAAGPEDAEAIISAARNAGRWLAVGFQDIYASEVHSLKHALLTGAIGQIIRIKAQVNWPRSHEYYARNRWAGRLKIDGSLVLDSPLNNAAAHYLMLALFFAGPVFSAAARVSSVQAELFRAQPIESFDTAAARFQTVAGIEILIIATHSGIMESVPEITIEGAAGHAVWRYQEGSSISAKSGTATHWSARDEFAARDHMLNAVANRLDDGTSFVCTPEIAREHARAINLLHDSTPIQSVASEFLEHISGPNGKQTVIRGLDADIARAYTAGRLWTEIGCDWAMSDRSTSAEKNHSTETAS